MKKIIITIGMFLVLTIAVVSNLELEKKEIIELTADSCFTIDETTQTITEYKNVCGTKINIPRQINGIEVKKIASMVFSNSNLTVVILPDTLEEIGIGTFENNEINRLELNDGLKTIKPNAFLNNSIEELFIPSSLVSVGKGAFNNNKVTGENEYIYMRSETGIDDSTVIGYAGSLKEIILPENIEYIYIEAFKDLSLNSVVFNDGLKRIQSNSFLNNNIIDIIIPESVEVIEANAFSNNPLENVIINGKESFDDFEFHLNLELVFPLSAKIEFTEK